MHFVKSTVKQVIRIFLPTRLAVTGPLTEINKMFTAIGTMYSALSALCQTLGKSFDSELQTNGQISIDIWMCATIILRESFNTFVSLFIDRSTHLLRSLKLSFERI